MLYTGGNNEVLRLVMLQHQPHAFHIVLRIAPVSLGIQIAQIEFILDTAGDSAGCQCDLTGNESLSPALGFMVEQNAVDCEHIIRFSVFLHDPEAVLFCHRIGAVGMERGVLILRHFFHSAIEFGCGCLINTAGLGQSHHTHSLQNPQHAQCIYISGIFRCLKAYLYMALGAQIVDFIRSDFSDDAHQAGGIRHVSAMENDLVLPDQMVDTAGIADGRSADQSMHFISFFQQELCQIRAVLSGNSCN